MKRIFAGVLATLTALLLAATLAPAQATSPDGKSLFIAEGSDKFADARACRDAARLPDRNVAANERHVDLRGCRASRTTFDVKVHVWPHWKNKPVRLHVKKNGKWSVIRKKNTNGMGRTTFAAIAKGSYKVSIPARGDYRRSESQPFSIG